MNCRALFFFLLFAALHLRAQTAADAPASAEAASPLSAVQKSYEAGKDAVAADRAKWLTALDTWYLGGLDALLQERTKAGDLDGVVAVKTERERVAAHADPTPEQARTMPPALRALRGTYDTNLLRVLDEVTRRTSANNVKLLADLDALQKSLTKAEKIDEAVQVKAERERLIAEFAVTAPPPAPAPATAALPPASAPPAVRAPFGLPGKKPEAAEQIGALTTKHPERPVLVTDRNRIVTERKFKPPVEITVVAQTSNTDLRIGYAADQIIFNWEKDQTQFRIDGGPAAGHYKPGAGGIPKNKFVTIRWRVTPTKQSIFVDDELRFEDEGDYSKINNPISVFTIRSSKVEVQSIKVAPLPADAQ